MLDLIGTLLAVIGAGVLAYWTGTRKGRKQGEEAVKDKLRKDAADARERIEDADLGGGATDRERIQRLREFADRGRGD